MIRLHLELAGTIQGVGFRPFVYRLARELGLAGQVQNSASGVAIEIQGGHAAVEQFVTRLRSELPPHASVTGLARCEIPVRDGSGFHIAPSSAGAAGAPPAEILPDLATCPECLAEILEPADRRYGYPFTNCTRCGPRFSIVLGLPYDRANTTMRAFAMCPRCQAEYTTPDDRRFHAQPNACPDCGPQLSWLDASGAACERKGRALERAALAIECGQIVAVKGIGGFHLLADARNPETIGRLRQRKHRPAKPFALMLPSLEAARQAVEISDTEAHWLSTPAAPVVILQRREACRLPGSLAPGNPGLGVMLPYSPLHHLLMRRLGFAVVATSGNRGDEPICIDNDDAVTRLHGIADGFLVHDRPVARPVDDSVMRIMAGREMLLRRSRGFAPAPIPVAGISATVLAYGGDLKGTIAVADRNQIRLSQHFGDLASVESRRAFEHHVTDFPALCRAEIGAVACDRHPAYHSRQLAESASRNPLGVQHHHAHVIACAAENGIGADEELLGVAWDGTGYGDDGTIWGGEFLLCRGARSSRFAWLRPFPLPGGEKAVRDPRFAALGCLHAAGIPISETPMAKILTGEEQRIATTLIDHQLNAPLCSSVGRMFDAVSALCGLCHHNDFEGQAAQALEFVASKDPGVPAYPIGQMTIAEGQAIDWTPLLRCVVDDLAGTAPDTALVSRRFHQSLAKLVTMVANQAARPIVALTGGCFQNALLLELTIAQLREAGHRPIWHRRVPPNDGGLAFGQAVVASRLLSHQTG